MAGKYQADSEYKDSGAEWLGLVPEHWKLKRFKFVANAQKGKLPKKIVADEDGVFPPYLTMDYLRTGYAENFVDDKEVTPINEGEALLLWDGANAGEFIKSRYGVISSTVAHVKFFNQLNKQFCWHFAKLLEIQLRTSTVGMGVPHVSGENLNNLIFCEPPKLEQEIIASFLDHETAKIDALIDNQQQLIKLLKEKRQSVISHAVTKGLNPDAPMRDSGVEWLGKVPEHWAIKRFKNLFKIKKRIVGTLGHDILSITQNGIKIKNIESGEGQLSMDYSKYQIVNEGDFAMNHMDLLTGFVDISSHGGVTSPDYRVFTLSDKNSFPEYYLYFLQMGYLNKMFYPFGQGAANLGRWRLPTEAFNDFIAPYPPKDEQIEIANFIAINLTKMSFLVDKANSAIKLMQERRAALISAAVTGKIDVRHWQAVPFN